MKVFIVGPGAPSLVEAFVRDASTCSDPKARLALDAVRRRIAPPPSKQVVKVAPAPVATVVAAPPAAAVVKKVRYFNVCEEKKGVCVFLFLSVLFF